MDIKNTDKDQVVEVTLSSDEAELKKGDTVKVDRKKKTGPLKLVVKDEEFHLGQEGEVWGSVIK